MRIRQTIIEIFKAFERRLSEQYPNDAKKWSYPLTLNARLKDENFFHPAQISYEKGRKPTPLLTEQEQVASAVNADLYARYKKEFIDIYQGRAEFKAPVLRVKASDSEVTWALFPPYVNTHVSMPPFSMQELKDKGQLKFYPPIPKSYD